MKDSVVAIVLISILISIISSNSRLGLRVITGLCVDNEEGLRVFREL